MKWEKDTADIISIVYDGTNTCKNLLMEKDLFVKDEPGIGEVLMEAYGLCSSETIGEIHKGDRIVIALNKAFIVADEYYHEKVHDNTEVPLKTVPKKSGRGCYCDVALFIDGMANLRTVSSIFKALNDADIYEDYSTLEFAREGLYFEAKTDKEYIEEDIEKIRKDWGWLKIDWETMNEWEPIGEEDLE